eukprot:2007088-Prymnesium_polylepis.1
MEARRTAAAGATAVQQREDREACARARAGGGDAGETVGRGRRRQATRGDGVVHTAGGGSAERK